MLPPVAAVSSTSAVSAQREVAAATEVLAGLTAAPDGAVAPSLAVSSGVEGKLNMLLIAARERMIDSLFDVIDAVSQSLALPQQAGESNAGYALRLADTVTALPPQQLATLQQQLTAQGQNAPLALVASALHDPTGAQAAQLVAYLEVVRYKDKDLATKSVVASYGQNDGSTEPETASSLQTPARAIQAQASATTAPSTAAPQASLSSPALPPGAAAIAAATADLPNALQDAAAPLPPAVIAATASEDVAEPLPQALAGEASTPSPPAVTAPSPSLVSPSASAGTTPLPTPAQAAAPQALQSSAPETGTAAAQVTSAPTAPATGAADGQATVPRAMLQIRSDIENGLKVVVDRLVEATGAQLLQTMTEAAPLADKIIAQALIADMIDGTELQGLPTPDDQPASERPAPASNALPVSLTSANPIEEQAAPLVAASQQLADTPDAAPTQPVVPQAAIVPPVLGVGFVTVAYAPAEDVIKNKDPMRVDLVDAVDDDEHEEQGQQQQDAEREDDPETSAEEALELLGAGPDESAAPVDGPPASRSSLIALPQPAPAEPVRNPAYDFYERMGV